MKGRLTAGKSGNRKINFKSCQPRGRKDTYLKAMRFWCKTEETQTGA